MIQLLMSGIGFFVASLIIWLVRKDRMHVNHGLGWLVVAFAFLLFGFTPSLVDRFATLVGVAYPPALALTLAVVVLVVKTLLMDLDRSRLEMRNQRLTQRIAILEARLSRLQASDEAISDRSDDGESSDTLT